MISTINWDFEEFAKVEFKINHGSIMLIEILLKSIQANNFFASVICHEMKHLCKWSVTV